METINLPESDLSEMKQFYIEELNKTLRRLQHIQTMLGNLGETGIQIQISTTQGQVSPSAAYLTKTGEPKREKKRPGRKSVWETVILKRLRQIDRPVTYEELTDEIMSLSRLPDSKRTSTKQAILNVVFRLRNRDKKLDTFSIGEREKYIALNSWFDSPGQIKREYAQRIEANKKAKKADKAKAKA